MPNVPVTAYRGFFFSIWQDLGVVSAHLVAVGLPERTLGIDRLEKSKLCTIHGSIPPHVLIVFEVI